LRRAIVLRFGLEEVRRRVWTVRRRGFGEALRPRRASRHAFLLTPPACLIAHLGSLLTLTTQRLREAVVKSLGTVLAVVNSYRRATYTAGV